MPLPDASLRGFAGPLGDDQERVLEIAGNLGPVVMADDEVPRCRLEARA